MATPRARWLVPALVVVATSLLAANAGATTMIALSLADLSLAADEVVVATVIASTGEPARGTIITRHVVRVQSSIAGSAGESEELEVIEAGGEHGGIGVLVDGAPRLRRGQRYLLFLRRISQGFTVVGQAQGAFRVHTSADDGATIVEPAESLPHLVRRDRGQLVTTTPAIVTPTPLNNVVARVREVRDAR